MPRLPATTNAGAVPFQPSTVGADNRAQNLAAIHGGQMRDALSEHMAAVLNVPVAVPTYRGEELRHGPLWDPHDPNRQV